MFTTWLNRGSLPGAAQIAAVMLAVVIALILLERRGRRDRRYTLSTRVPGWRDRSASRLGRAASPSWPAHFRSSMGFVLPVCFLFREVASRGLLDQLDEPFLEHLLTTIGLASVATVAALLLGFVVVTASRLAKTHLTRTAQTIAGFGYAVPGTVLALGLLGASGRLRRSIEHGLALVHRSAPRPRAHGSAAAIVVAYTIRFLPIATGSLAAGLDRVSSGIEDAARTLGAQPRGAGARCNCPC